MDQLVILHTMPPWPTPWTHLPKPTHAILISISKLTDNLDAQKSMHSRFVSHYFFSTLHTIHSLTYLVLSPTIKFKWLKNRCRWRKCSLQNYCQYSEFFTESNWSERPKKRSRCCTPAAGVLNRGKRSSRLSGADSDHATELEWMDDARYRRRYSNELSKPLLRVISHVPKNWFAK